MAPPSKSSAAASARRKSSKGPLMVVLKLSPKHLQAFIPSPIEEEVKEEKEESPAKDSPSSSSNSNTLPVASSSNGDNKTESNAGTPAAAGTPVPNSLMPPPPTEGPKKKGNKRSAAVALGPDGQPIPKVRGKPGPKKKARLEDGSIDHSQTVPRAANGTTHKLGPKANQGAINAGLRALDRSGKPCRKWQKGGFTLKSFTGIVWEIPRWKAPPRFKIDGTQDGSTSGDSQKENKGSQVESEKSNSAVDVVMASSPVSTPSAAPEPAPVEAIQVEPAAPSNTPEVLVTEPTIEVTVAA